MSENTGDPFEEVMREQFGDTARRLLMEMLKAGCTFASECHGEGTCFYCSSRVDHEPHAASCPYANAIVVFGDPACDDSRPVGIIKA
jgi:ferredoxin